MTATYCKELNQEWGVPETCSSRPALAFIVCSEQPLGETVTRCPLKGNHLGDIVYDNRKEKEESDDSVPQGKAVEDKSRGKTSLIWTLLI